MSEYSDNAHRCATTDRTTACDGVLKVAVHQAITLTRAGRRADAEATLTRAARSAERILGNRPAGATR